MRDIAALKGQLAEFYALEKAVDEELQLLELAENREEYNEILCGLELLLKKVKDKEIECLFCGEADKNNCFIEIQAGAGGTDSNDWADMLLRMYLRWAEGEQKFKVTVVNHLPGEEVGIKSTTLKVIGKNAYGWLRTENGVHRLVRISPFNANGKRHTSFANVSITPLLDDEISILLNEKDLRIDTYRASGAGGQHINKTDSAVRITHLPTGIIVQSQNDRSQHKNRKQALDVLKARLYALELRKKEEKALVMRGKQAKIGWGEQIRSYVLHPYQLVKDLRTNYETGNIQAVLNGDLNDFIYRALSMY